MTDVLWITGAAAVVDGVTWLLLAGDDEPGDAATVRIVPGVGSDAASVTLSGRF